MSKHEIRKSIIKGLSFSSSAKSWTQIQESTNQQGSHRVQKTTEIFLFFWEYDEYYLTDFMLWIWFKKILYIIFPPHSLNLNLCAQHIWRMMMRKTKKRTHHAIANIAEKNSRWWFLVQKVFKVSEFNWNEGKKQELQFVGTPHHHWGSFSHQEWVSKYKPRVGDGKSSQSARIGSA